MEKQELNAKDSSNALILCLFFNIFGSTVIAMVIATIITLTTNKKFDINSFTSNAWLYGILSFLIGILIIVGFFIINRGKENKVFSKPKLYKIVIYILIGVILNFLLTPIVNMLDLGLDKLNLPAKDLGYTLTTTNYLISIVTLALFPAVFEELLFRGLVFKGLKKYGKAFAIVLSTLAFCLYHLSIRQTLYPILFGLALGLVMHKENNLIYCMILHFVNNFTTLTLSYFNVIINIEFAMYAILAVVALVAYLATILVFVFKDNNKKESLNKNEKIYLASTFIIMLILWILFGIM